MEWRTLGAQFDELSKADNDKLFAAWLPRDERNPRWRLGGQWDQELLGRFKALAGRGAVLLGHPPGPSAFWFWLDLLKRESPHYQSVRQRRKKSNDTFQVAEGGAIGAVCAVSKAQCFAIEDRAIHDSLPAYKSVEHAFARLERLPGYAQAELQLMAAEHDRLPPIAADMANWDKACEDLDQGRVGYYNALGEIWLGLVTNSQSAHDFCMILPEIFSGAYRKFFGDEPLETLMPVGKAHQFRADIDLLDKSFRGRAALRSTNVSQHDLEVEPSRNTSEKPSIPITRSETASRNEAGSTEPSPGERMTATYGHGTEAPVRDAKLGAEGVEGSCGPHPVMPSSQTREGGMDLATAKPGMGCEQARAPDSSNEMEPRELPVPVRHITGPPGTSPNNRQPAAARDPDKGNLQLLTADGKLKRAVTLETAARFGGVSRRAIEQAAQEGGLSTEGRRQQRRVLVESLLKYFPPEK